MSKRVKVTVKKSEVKSQNSLSRKQKTNSSKSPGSPVNHILHLQRTLGNQVVQRMMKSGALQAKLRNSTSCPVFPRRCPFGGACHTCPARVQAKLRIGQPNDKYEQEADRVADQVMRMPDLQRSPGCVSCGERGEEEPIRTKPLAGQITPLVQRQVEPEEEEEEEPVQAKVVDGVQVQRQEEEPEEEEEEPIQTKLVGGGQVQRQEEEPEEEEEEPLQTKQSSGQMPQGSRGVETQIHSMKGGGQPLPKSTRAFFEQRFDYDFSQVRVHTSAQAVESTRAVNARAFTRGHDIVFGAGQFSTGTNSGRRLLAHELTHVVQQQQGIKRKVTNSAKVLQCWRWGTGTVPGEPNFMPVTRNHRPRVRAAMRILRGIVRSRRCRNYFRDNCPGGTTATLRNLYRRMRVWGLHEAGSLGGNSGDHVAYEEPYIYRVGRFSIAATLLHEMMHMCGIGTTAADERTCERAVERCRAYTPFIESVAPRSGRVGTIVRITGYGFGLSQGPADRVEVGGVNAGRALRWRYTHGVGSEIRIRVPAGARTGSIVVINNRVRSNRRRFRVLP